MNLLLPIKPRFAEAIMEGRKEVEFRKARFRHPVERAVIYATAPRQEIVGLFEVCWLEYDCPDTIWNRHGRQGAISRRDFFRYYNGTELACAMGVGEVTAFLKAFCPREHLGQFVIPQQFRYLRDLEVQAILRVAEAHRQVS